MAETGVSFVPLALPSRVGLDVADRSAAPAIMTPPMTVAPSSTSATLTSFGALMATFTMAAAAGRRRHRSGNSGAAARAARKVRSGKAIALAASTNSEVVDTAETYLLNNYGKRNVAVVRGEGHRLIDVEGRSFLDFTSGIAVNCLGHSDPGWAKVVGEQAATLAHTSNMFLNEHQVSVGKKLVEHSFGDKAFFCNSGTEANEAAIKFSRKFHVATGKPRERLIAFQNSFHGRTMGSLALTWKQAYKTPFEPLMPSSEFLPFNDIEAIEKGIDESVCAVFVEPMQGEGGVIPASTEFLTALRRRCDEVGAILVFDEVQCGLGRTGKLFAHEHSGVTPDLMTLAKPLAGGLPIGAVVLTERIAATIAPGDHGSTFAGAPLVCAAADYTFDRVSDKAFLDNVENMGNRLRTGLQNMVAPRGFQVRGLGLLNGVVFEDAETCGKVQAAARDLGLLVLTAGKGNVLRIAPALTVGPAEVDEALFILSKAFASLDK